MSHLPITALKLYSGAVSHGEWMSFLDEALSSSRGPLLASLSAFWLRLSEKASSLTQEGKGRAIGLRWLRAHTERKSVQSFLAIQ